MTQSLGNDMGNLAQMKRHRLIVVEKVAKGIKLMNSKHGNMKKSEILCTMEIGGIQILKLTIIKYKRLERIHEDVLEG